MIIFNCIRYIILLFIILFVVLHVVAQKQNNIWYFGNKAGLDFNSNPPTGIQSPLTTLEGTASICDPAGNLLFYTNGETVWDRNHDIMPNGNSLLGGESSTQAALILPLPNSCTKYCIFVTEDHFTDGGLSYSVVDMCLNDGLGDIISGSKSIILADQTAEKITAIPHSNGSDIWIISHKLNSRDFLAYLLTPSGVSINPVISTVGSFYNSQAHIGPVKASYNGTKIVSSATFYNIVEMFDFDAATGVLSNANDVTQIFGPQQYVYGVEFSPNDSLLYLSTTFVNSTLYQLNLGTFELATLNTQPGNYHYGALQMGSDEKIYMARNDSSFLDVIHAPNNPGASSQYEEKGIKLLNGTFSTLGLPNFAPYSYFRNNGPVLLLGNDTLICNGETLPLKINLTTSCGAFSYLWSNGSNESEIVVSQKGIYWVEITNACVTLRDSIQVSFAACQPICNQTSGSILGSATEVQRGYSLSPAMDNKSFYVAGLKNDSITITKMALNGAVEWFRILDLAMGLAAHISTVILDSEGNLILAGNLGGFPFANSTFVIKYNPDLNTILWSKSYTLTPGSTHFALTQMDPGGNYLISITTNYSNTDNANLIELDNTTGEPVSPIFVEYHLGASEGLSELVYHEGFIYGIGRYTDGFSPADMRSTIVKLNGTDASQVWVRLGHIASNSTARLYGADLVIYEDNIYSVYFGDPSGTSLINNTLYLQRTNLDGELIWLKSYSLPGTTGDAGIEIIRSDDGFVVMAKERSSASSLILFKVDENGNVLWARSYSFPDYITAFGDLENGRTSQLIKVGEKLIFTGFGNNQTGGTNMIVVVADLEGGVEDGCINSTPVSITVSTVSNPVFYSVNPTTRSVPPQVNELAISVINSIQYVVCSQVDTLVETISVFICQGEVFEGYTASGVYVDSFITAEGCDSIRTLDLAVSDPQKYLAVTLCNGEKFDQYTQSGMYIDTLGSVEGECDTVRFLDLTFIPAKETYIDTLICEGQSFLGYNVTGLYIDTFITVEGCDSVRTLELTVISPEKYLNLTLCNGEKFEQYYQSGIYTDTLGGFSGDCDTVRYLDLTIIPGAETFIDVSICEGQIYLGYNTTGLYIDTLEAVNGCDSIRILQLNVETEIFANETKSICLGDTYRGYATPGIYIDTFQASFGCDSIVRLDLSIEPEVKTLDVEICNGERFENYLLPGFYVDTIHGIATPCDTIRQLTLIVNQIQETSYHKSLCTGEFYEGYLAPGTYIDTLVTSKGCDSIRTLELTELDLNYTHITKSVCEGSLLGYSKAGVYIDTLISSVGCDTIRTLVLEAGSKFIPNVFSPNGDGINDIFSVSQSSDQAFGLQYFGLFDRYGDMVYQATSWPVNWDGNNRSGIPYQSGVFSFVFIYTCGVNTIIEHGNVTLLR